ncbi:MAG: hypothetical protein ACOYM3_01095 [Terrimicrobiaceae bacterium]
MTGMSDGQQVSSWTDSSGNGLTVARTASASVVYKANIKNGLPVLRWTQSPTSTALTKSSVASSLLTDGTWCAIGVFCKNGATTDAGFVAWTQQSANNQMSGWIGNSSSLYFDFGKEDGTGRINVAQPAGWATNWHIMAWRRDAGNIQKILDQTTELVSASRSAVPSGSSVWKIGNTNSGINPMVGDLAEIVVYKSAVGATDYANLIAYYKTLYGI